MRVAIVGSRDYPNMALVREFVSVRVPDGATIVSGGARGVDSVAEDAARKRGLSTLIFPADWMKYGKRAGFYRNQTIVENADYVIAFWDGESRGTANSIHLARLLGKPLRIYGPDGAVMHE